MNLADSMNLFTNKINSNNNPIATNLVSNDNTLDSSSFSTDKNKQKKEKHKEKKQNKD